MRVCPKCGYVDPPEWRHSKYSYWIDFCEVYGFEKLYPKLHTELVRGVKLVEDKYYLYRITKNKGKVERKAKVDYGDQWNIPMENPKRWSGKWPDFDKKWNYDKSQTKLLEVTK